MFNDFNSCLVMYHQPVATERYSVAVEWTAVSSFGYAAIVEVIGGAALGTGGTTLHTYTEAHGGEVARGTAQIIGIVLLITEVGLADDKSCKTKAEDSAMHLGVGDGLLASIGLSHLVPLFCRGRAHGKEVPRCLHLVEGRLADVA